MRGLFPPLRHFLTELKRRNVYKVAVTYLVAGFVVVQVADLAAGAFGMPSWFEPMVWVLAGLGLPIAVVLAWAFEVSPEGVRRTPAREWSEERVRGPSGTGLPGRRQWTRGLVAVGLIAAAAMGGWYLVTAGEPEGTDRSIAVLPFEATGGEEGVQFSKGLHDGLLTRLTNVAALTVKSRTSAERYEGTDHTIPEIARELDVAWIVEGAVHQSGDRIRVNATLIDAREDDRRWARDYERDLTVENVFAIQSDLARTIAGSLQAELSPREAERLDDRPTDDLEAYRLYVQGLIHLDRRTEAGMRRSVDHFRSAIERDSSYAPAWAGLADARHILALFGYDPADTLLPGALDAARRAFELDPELAEARASLGLLYDQYLHDLPAALRELERAVELKPSYARAHQWLGTLEGALGHPEAALEHVRRAAELDPQSAVTQLVLGWTYWWIEGPGSRALAHVRRAIELEPALAVAHADEGLILSDAGRHEEAIVSLQRALERTSEGSFEWGLSIAGLGVIHARMGDTARSREMLTRLQESGEAPFWQAVVHAAIGEQTAAFQALRAVEWTTISRWDLLVLPAFDSLRDDPRYDELIRDIDRRWGLDPDGSLPDG